MFIFAIIGKIMVDSEILEELGPIASLVYSGKSVQVEDCRLRTTNGNAACERHSSSGGSAPHSLLVQSVTS